MADTSEAGKTVALPGPAEVEAEVVEGVVVVDDAPVEPSVVLLPVQVVQIVVLHERTRTAGRHVMYVPLGAARGCRITTTSLGAWQDQRQDALSRKPFIEPWRPMDNDLPLCVSLTSSTTHRHKRAKMPKPDPRIVHERSATRRQGIPFQPSAQLAHAAAGMDATAGLDASSVLASATSWLAVLGGSSAHHLCAAGHGGGQPAGSRRQQITGNAQVGDHWWHGCRRAGDRQLDGRHPGPRVRPHRLGGSSLVVH